MRKLILASQSPRRKELLEKCGYPFDVIVADIDESIDSSLTLENAIQQLAYKKAKKIFDDYPDAIVIGSDTIVSINKKILGKPKDEQEAFNMLKLLSGKTHEVITGLTILTKEKTYNHVSVNKVTFYDLSDEEYLKFISGEELSVNLDNHYYQVTYKGLPLGFGKCSNKQLKNKYPKGLRRMV